jgi:membrane associated rhomboid family serine protease
MIPLQDVVPSGRIPIATLALVAINAFSFAAQLSDASLPAMLPPFRHAAVTPFVVGTIFLWVFGDNVEARLGRVLFVAIYLAGGWLAPLGAAGGVTAVMGAYFVLLPYSRILVLVPVPEALIEIPAPFFLGLWAIVQVPVFVELPATMWTWLAALVLGAAVCRVMRRPIAW